MSAGDGSRLWQREPRSHYLRGSFQISDGLEQGDRHDRSTGRPLPTIEPRLLEQDMDLQEIRHTFALRYDVGRNAIGVVELMRLSGGPHDGQLQQGLLGVNCVRTRQ